MLDSNWMKELWNTRRDNSIKVGDKVTIWDWSGVLVLENGDIHNANCHKHRQIFDVFVADGEILPFSACGKSVVEKYGRYPNDLILRSADGVIVFCFSGFVKKV